MTDTHKALIWLGLSILLAVIIFYQLSTIREYYGIITNEGAIWPKVQ